MLSQMARFHFHGRVMFHCVLLLLFSRWIMSDSFDTVDCSPPGSSIHEISQARILEWIAISFSRGSSWPMGQNLYPCVGRQFLYTESPGKPIYISVLLLLLSRFSCVRLCATPQTAAHQALPSLGFSRQEHWSGLPFPFPMHESESEVAQSCPTVSDPMDCSLPGSSIHGIFQARVLEWGAIAFSSKCVYSYINNTSSLSIHLSMNS